jgi:hypothetical protein
MRLRVHSRAVHFLGDGKVFSFELVIRVILLEHRKPPAVASKSAVRSNPRTVG